MAESRALSRWEIDALLNEMSESDGSDDPAAAAAGSAVAEDESAFTRVIKNYDFRRPDKFSRDQWHTLRSMHDTFARLVGAAISSRLRTPVSVRLSSIDQGLYEEWQSQVPTQTVCYVFSMQPLSGSIVVEFNSDVAVEVIDRLLGGSGALLQHGHELGEIELALLRSFSRAIATSLEEVWSAFAPVKPELQDVGEDAGLIQAASPNDAVISAFFEVNLGNHLGAMSVCVPYTVLEPIAGKLSAQLWRSSGPQARPSARSRRMVEALLGAAPVEITVELGAADVPVRSVLEMTAGDTLLLDARADRALLLLAGGIPRFRCRPGLVGKQISVRVTEVIEERAYDFDQDDDESSADTPDGSAAADMDSPTTDSPTPEGLPPPAVSATSPDASAMDEQQEVAVA